MKQFCSYLRVSTQKQGEQGLGISAQRSMCENFIKQNNGSHLREFIDVESGTHRDRKGLWSAIDYCKKNKCSLVIAKLDRLARDVEFTFKVINTGIDIHFTDMPVVNSMILGVFAAVAQYEREMMSTRTTQALAAKKARGEKTGGACEKWRESYNKKSKEQLKEENMKRGRLKNERFLQSKETQVFVKILRNVFPSACSDANPSNWDWGSINTKNGAKDRILSLMKDYRDMDDTLFANFNFDDVCTKVQTKLCVKIQNLRTSVRTNVKIKEEIENEY